MQFYMISVSFFHVSIVNNRGKCPLAGVLARFYTSEGWGFELFFARGGWSGLELTDTLYHLK